MIFHNYLNGSVCIPHSEYGNFNRTDYFFLIPVHSLLPGRAPDQQGAALSKGKSLLYITFLPIHLSSLTSHFKQHLYF